jgi:hypothetical protein
MVPAQLSIAVGKLVTVVWQSPVIVARLAILGTGAIVSPTTTFKVKFPSQAPDPETWQV